jgi:hypothetical protein
MGILPLYRVGAQRCAATLPRGEQRDSKGKGAGAEGSPGLHKANPRKVGDIVSFPLPARGRDALSKLGPA